MGMIRRIYEYFFSAKDGCLTTAELKYMEMHTIYNDPSLLTDPHYHGQADFFDVVDRGQLLQRLEQDIEHQQFEVDRSPKDLEHHLDGCEECRFIFDQNLNSEISLRNIIAQYIEEKRKEYRRMEGFDD